MIRDLTETLNAILTQPGLPAELAAATVSFDRPVEPFNPAHPTVNLFLYDVRENGELRQNEPNIRRSNGTATIQQPPRRILCSYLATAWVNQNPDPVYQEHRLLTQVLQVLSRYPTIPADLARGTIKTSDPPVPLQAAVGTTATGISEFWSALGAKLRPSITVQATIALPVSPDQPAALVRTQKLVMGERQPAPSTDFVEATREESKPLALFGRVVHPGDPATDPTRNTPVADADVQIVENGWQMRTGSDGIFRFGPLPAGTYTLRISVAGKTSDVHRDVPVPSGNYDIQVS